MSIGSAETANRVSPDPQPVETVNHLKGEHEGDMASDIREGLGAFPKRIPCKYLYDARGSRLFEEICQLPEYYPTRSELSILERVGPEFMEACAHRDLVELGSGSSLKIRTLLDAAGESSRTTLRYIPVDISHTAVLEASTDLVERYPELRVLGIVADFTCQLDVLPAERSLMLCFLGSTIGNMEQGESISFLRGVAGSMRPDDSLLVGFDMVKSREVMEAAYNDSQGITAEFNKNVLNVLNNGLGADFDSHHFDHVAFFNEAESQIEMHLRANREVRAHLTAIDMEVRVEGGETIHTENSRKFTRESIGDMALRAGLSIRRSYSDPSGWVLVVVMGRNGAIHDDARRAPAEAATAAED